MGQGDYSYTFPHRGLLAASALNRVDLEIIFDSARTHLLRNRETDKKHASLKGLTVINLFFEASTRTLASFEIAAKRLGADVVNFSAGNASLKKGESLADTAYTLAAMRPDLLVVRHQSPGAAAFFQQTTGVSTLNAGDGANEHPTQALLDLFTLTEQLGDVGGKRIAIIGDILHSRVARSNVALLSLMNADIRLCGPASLLPADADRWGATVFHSVEAAVEGCDAVMVLRLQRERMSAGLIPSAREYAALYGLDHNRLALANEGCIVMHPGPMNRGIEITSALADDTDISLILDQVEAGVAIRMAMLELLAGRGMQEIRP
ncbi:MAG: aspartate carbamoyltransferase catalytic subunit [Caulobacterales bacterium]|uniref:aspartate carbamoyltransferase catalytic subunit n=1 Tax=Glycocaulis sp. TaxID=1969725 RepID=UPI003F9FB4A8